MQSHTIRRRSLALIMATLVVAALAPAGTASAGHVECGQVITSDTTLDSDVGPCATDGIVIGADSITLDLNGHELFGTPIDGQQAVGVRLQGRRDVTVTSSVSGGTIRDFDAGVAITAQSTGNRVTKIIARDNVGSSLTDFGDGIAISNSTNNVIRDNLVDHNGPFDGVGVFGTSSGNKIFKNEVVNNNIPSSATTNQDDGIRLEPDTFDNVVENNTVRNNGLDGIAVFFNSEGNVIRSNDVRNNGHHDKSHRKGDGIRLFLDGDSTEIVENKVFDNAASGIRVDSMFNEIRDNETGSNASASTPDNPAYDLYDTNEDCDDNVWSNNTFDTAFPDCTKA